MAVLEFLTGLLLMLGFYIAFSLMGTVIVSYLTGKIMQILHYTLSVRERIRKQRQQFLYRKQALEKRYLSKKIQFKQKTSNQQQLLHDANTKVHLQHLARETHKQLINCQNHISPEIRHSTKQAVKQCVNQLDMKGLITINLSLYSQQNPEKIKTNNAK